MDTDSSGEVRINMAKSPEAHRRKLIYLWGCIAVAAIIAVVVGTWATSRHQPPKGTMTVGDAVAGGVVQEEAPAQVNGAVGGDASSEANRVMSLAKALGIPLESVPRDITQNQSGKSDVRQYLERELKSAVASGELDEDDEKAIIGAFEKAIIGAFEKGIVIPASDGIVAESAPAN